MSTALLSLSLQAGSQEMPKSLAEAERWEGANSLPLTAIFSASLNGGKSEPGDLLAHETYPGYSVPAGVNAQRIIYHSQDAEGHDVTASAVVLTPPGQRPKEGWPVIVWAHGTSGVARQCAPSLMKDLYYGQEGLFAFLAAGFAVVAVDYHGLGTPGPHQYVDKVAQAHDVIYALPAARAAEPALGRKWVVDGHSQGGLAAWGTAELESARRDPDYLGAVSVAGALRLHELFAHLRATPGVGFYLAFMAYGIHARFPEFEPADMLTPTAMRSYAAVTTQGCWYAGYAAYLGVQGNSILNPGWDGNPWVQRYFKENALGEQPIGGPLLVIAGEGDTTVPIGDVRTLVGAACKAGMAVTFRSYPGLDHDPTMEQSVPDQLAWIKDRFIGKPAGRSCSTN
ncbi:MAG TPA: alpha/beta fold hydrolase [Steroidobacteraceae bacterium]